MVSAHLLVHIDATVVPPIVTRVGIYSSRDITAFGPVAALFSVEAATYDEARGKIIEYLKVIHWDWALFHVLNDGDSHWARYRWEDFLVGVRKVLRGWSRSKRARRILQDGLRVLAEIRAARALRGDES